jgi:hypothetical protein
VLPAGSVIDKCCIDPVYAFEGVFAGLRLWDRELVWHSPLFVSQQRCCCCCCSCGLSGLFGLCWLKSCFVHTHTWLCPALTCLRISVHVATRYIYTHRCWCWVNICVCSTICVCMPNNTCGGPCPVPCGGCTVCVWVGVHGAAAAVVVGEL